jgi:hypothetical protein
MLTPYQSFAADNSIVGTIVGFDCGEAAIWSLKTDLEIRRRMSVVLIGVQKEQRKRPPAGGAKGKVGLRYIGEGFKAKIGILSRKLASEGYYIGNIKFIK